MENRKMNALSLEEKYDLVQLHERDRLTAKELTAMYSCGKTQVYDTIKNKDKIKQKWLKLYGGKGLSEGIDLTVAVPKVIQNLNVTVPKIMQNVNVTVYEWLLNARIRAIPVTNQLLRSQAKLVADELKWYDFRPSNSWINNFKKMYNLKFSEDGIVETVSENSERQNSIFEENIIPNVLPVPKIESVVSLVDCETMIHTPEDLSIRGLLTDGLPPREANRCLRIQLAAAHRALAEYGISEGTFNHLSVMSPAANGDGEVMLITPFPVQFSQVTPSSLLGLNVDGQVVEGDSSVNSSSCSFHRGFYLTDPSKKCLMRTHSTYVSVLACLQDCKFKMVHHISAPLLRSVVYTSRESGMDSLEEGILLGSLMRPNNKAILIRNNGSVAADHTVFGAFNRVIAMENTAKTQILAMQTNQKIKEIDSQCLESSIHQLENLQTSSMGEAHLRSVIDRLAKSEFEFQYD